MRKTARRFQLQPAVEGLDRRIAPSSMMASPDSQSSDTSTDSTDTHPVVCIRPQPPGTGSGGGGTGL